MKSTLATELKVQANTLIQDAPDDRITTQGVVTITPILAKFALTRLNQAYYYLIQDPDGALLRETFIHPTQSTVEKTMIFAFPTLEDASQSRDSSLESDYLAVKTPIVEILFRFWALNWCDALVFFEVGDRSDRSQGQEISHKTLTTFIQKELAASSSRPGGKGFGKVC